MGIQVLIEACFVVSLDVSIQNGKLQAVFNNFTVVFEP